MTTTSYTQGIFPKQSPVDKIVEVYKDIFTSPIVVPQHFQVKHSIELIPCAPLSNDKIYRCSLLENEEIQFQIRELI